MVCWRMLAATMCAASGKAHFLPWIAEPRPRALSPLDSSQTHLGACAAQAGA
jgi:hypothetical protein